ncbi:type II methionyl aminopeptidase [Candidatus Woesearchaeota archaeon]|nr:type II methionyl aminopeptidase [Candidatus Woesearchaeota archaeon]
MEDIEKWRKACSITAEAREYGKSLIVKGASMKDVSSKIEDKIASLGGKPAFPAQISCDHIAAHYCVDEDDIIFDSQLAKLDLGVHIDGCIGDTAVSVDLSGRNAELVNASREALEAAISTVRAGVTVSVIGRAIQDVITGKGFAPIRNLSGHGLAKYDVHTIPTIPNFENGDHTKLEDGQIVAIEPFATTGSGVIQEAGNATVFMLVQKRPVRDPFVRAILQHIEGYGGVPFAKRWLVKKFPKLKVNLALRQMMQLGIIRDFPPLAEREKGLVSQAEHTLLVTKEGCEVLTKKE